MSEVWKRIMKKYIDCYESIQTLATHGIIDEEEKAVHEHNVLFNLVETFKSEVEE